MNDNKLCVYLAKLTCEIKRMNMKKADPERERLLGSNRMNPLDDAINDGNEVMIDDLEEKTSRLLFLTKNVDQTLRRDEDTRRTLADSVDKSDLMMSKGRQFISDVTNDPTYFGVFKIAMLVFTSLCILYFGGKFLFRFVFKSKK